jgi:hypothetical protein
MRLSMPNMDLGSFYLHALQWKHQKEEEERQITEEQLEKITATWKIIAGLIREALPIEGMTLHETDADMFTSAPKQGHLIDIDCCLDPALLDSMMYLDQHFTRNVIRVRVCWDLETAEPCWKILKYIIYVDGKAIDFDNPYAAFLAAYSPAEAVKID